MPKIVLRGRSEEVATGITLLRRTRSSGHGAVLVIEGRAGIGKSALLTELRSQAHSLGFRCGMTKADKIAHISPAAAALLAVRSGSQPLLTNTDFERIHGLVDTPLLMLDELAALLEREASSGPLLVGIDDAQWVDPVSRLLLRSLPSRLAGSPLVWVITSRPSEDGLANDLKQHIAADPPVDVLTLSPLGSDDIDAMARDRLNRPPSDDLSRLLAGAGGNPFYAAQILDGIVRAPQAQNEADVPAQFILSVRRRIAEVDPEAAELVQVAAVFGQPLRMEDLRALLPAMTPDLVLKRIDALEHAGLLTTDRAARTTFAHDLVREAVYADLTDRTRRALHLRCAKHLVATGGDPLTMAAHARSSITTGDTDTAALLLEAADIAAGVMPETAADLVLAAFYALRPESPGWRSAGLRSVELLGLVQRCDEALDVAGRLLANSDDADEIGEIEVAAARTLWLTNRWDAAVQRSAHALAREGLSETMKTRLTSLHALARSRVEPAALIADDAERALTAADRIEDQTAAALARHALAEITRNRADHVSSLRHYRELRALSSPTYIGQEIQGLQHLDRFNDADVLLRQIQRDMGLDRGFVFLSLIYSQIWQDYHLGRLDQAEAGARTLLDVALERGSHSCGIDAASLLSLIALQRGDVAGARTRLTEGFGPAGADDERRTPPLLLVRGWVTAAEGGATHAVEILRPLVFDGRNERDPWPWKPGWLRMLAHLGLAAEDDEFTAEVVALAQIGAQRNPNVPSLAGTARHLLGLVEHDPALLAEAAAALADSPRPLMRAGVLHDLGVELVAAGHRSEGGQRLDAAWSLYRDVGAYGPMIEIQDHMRHLGFRRSQWQPVDARPEQGWQALTPTEAKVATLIAAGHTNKAAAEDLGISVNTVGTHLRSVFRKLDVRSRVQLSNLLHSTD